MDDLLSEFLTETSEALESLDVELVNLERNPNDPELLGNIFRLVHTIKGTCGFLGLPRLESVAHAAENVLGNFRDGTQDVTPEAVTLILEAIDCIKALVATLEETQAEPAGDDSDLIGRLDAMYELGKSGGGSVAATAPDSAGPSETADVDTRHETDTGSTDARTLAEQLGGISTIDTAVELVYRHAMQDQDLSQLLSGADLIRLQGHHVEAMTLVLEGKEAGDLEPIYAELAGLGFDQAHFGKLAALLADALGQLEVDEALSAKVVAAVAVEAPASEPSSSDAPANATADAVVEGPAEAATEPPEQTQPETAQSKQLSVVNQTIRVNVELLENLMTMVSELVLTRNQLMQMVRKFEDSEFNVPLQRLSHVTTELQEGVMKTRMQPIGNAWGKLPRIVRDLGLELAKKIDLQMLGAETELDRQVLELIKDPLTHMVRNCADHASKRRRNASRPENRNSARSCSTPTTKVGRSLFRSPTTDGESIPTRSGKRRSNPDWCPRPTSQTCLSSRSNSSFSRPGSQPRSK